MLYRNGFFSCLIVVLLLATPLSYWGGDKSPLPSDRLAVNSQDYAAPFTSASRLTDLPVAAQAAVSDSLGRDDAGYHMIPAATGYQANNPAHHLDASFTSEGVAIQAGSNQLQLQLVGYGYGETAPTGRLAGDAVPQANANRIEYARSAELTEWYINGPVGLEQGFTLAAPPPRGEETVGSPLRIDLGMAGTLRPKLEGDGQSLALLAPSGQKILQYGGLRSYDASGRELRSWLEAGPETVLIRVDDAGAVYPIVVDPYIFQAKLMASAGEAGDEFAISVALNRNGNTALIGAWGTNNKQGAAYVFTRTGTTWTQQARLTDADGVPGDQLGWSVALDGTGSIALISAGGKNNNQGVAIVFKRSGVIWTHLQTLQASDGAPGDMFGSSVALDVNGDTALIGARGKNTAYIFQLVAGSWIQNDVLVANHVEPGADFGISVALNDNGYVALVGAYHKTIESTSPLLVWSHPRQGAAYIFNRIPGGWSPPIRLVANDGATDDLFGWSVALGAKGSRALIGAWAKDVDGQVDRGAAYIFDGSGGSSWTQTAVLTASNGAAGDRFGCSVALSQDGNKAAVGAHWKPTPGKPQRGAVYGFSVNSSGVWGQQAIVTAGDGEASDHFGWAVAINSDVSTILVGAPSKRIGPNDNQGAAYVYVPIGASVPLQARLTLSDGGSYDGFGWSVALSKDGKTALIGACTKNVGTNTFQGVAYVFTRPGSIWYQQARLLAVDGEAGDRFGQSVALSGDGNTALIGAAWKTIDSQDRRGAAYLYTWNGTSWIPQHPPLLAEDGLANDFFGWSVALSGDGNTALIGAKGKDSGFSNQGAAYVFKSPSWTQQQPPLVADGGEVDDAFGYSVALSQDGNAALIGAPMKKRGPNLQQGAAYIFNWTGSSWAQHQPPLVANDGAAHDRFGWAVALNPAGNTALIGAPYKKILLNDRQGAAYVFTQSGPLWTHLQPPVVAGGGQANDTFGISVALRDDGKFVLIGALYKNVGPNLQQGAAYSFERQTSSWAQHPLLVATIDGAAGDLFGNSVALSGDASTALIGAYGQNIGTNINQGAAYVFHWPCSPSCD
jgi:hypothetical protein